MLRWPYGLAAVVGISGLVIAYPLAGQSQTATLTCGYGLTFSVATIKNINKKKKSAMCRWICVYQLTTGSTHVNRGSIVLPLGGTKKTKKSAIGIAKNTGKNAICP